MKYDYQQQCRKIKASTAGIDPYSSPRWLTRFTYFSANLEHFLPLVPVGEHPSLFRQALAYERLGELDAHLLTHKEPLMAKPLDGSFARQVRERPGIVCSMHTGAHLPIAHVLAREGVPLAILAAPQVNAQLDRFWNKGKYSPGMPDRPLLVNANHPGSIRQLAALLDRGVSILALIDGDSGATPSDRTKLLRIPFLGQHLRIRRGVTYLADQTETPIHPLFAFRHDDGLVGFHGFPPLLPGSMPVEQFSVWATMSLFDHFASLLLHHPMQWTNWFHLQKQIDTDGCFVPEGRQLSRHFGLLKVRGDLFLLDRYRYRALRYDPEYLNR